MYMNYIQGLQSTDSNTPSGERPYSQQSSTTTESYEDKNDDEAEVEDDQAKKNKTGHMPKILGGDKQQQMIDVSACEFSEFQAIMVG